MDKREKAGRVLDILKKQFPAARSALEFTNPLELLIATILSAQATDKLVNKLTPALFKKYPSARDYSEADLKDLEKDIGSINFYRNKAKYINACCAKIVSRFEGKVPDTIEELTQLPGVGRKTANVVLGNAFGKDALAVDTHGKRVANRLGLSSSDAPDEIEEDLSCVIPRSRWTETTHLFILHGRNTCKALNPKCSECAIQGYCAYYRAENI